MDGSPPSPFRIFLFIDILSFRDGRRMINDKAISIRGTSLIMKRTRQDRSVTQSTSKATKARTPMIGNDRRRGSPLGIFTVVEKRNSRVRIYIGVCVCVCACMCVYECVTCYFSNTEGLIQARATGFSNIPRNLPISAITSKVRIRFINNDR